jgi:hypothetical protein
VGGGLIGVQVLSHAKARKESTGQLAAAEICWAEGGHDSESEPWAWRRDRHHCRSSSPGPLAFVFLGLPAQRVFPSAHKLIIQVGGYE